MPAERYAILFAIRSGKVEALIVKLFGQEYVDYKQRTGRLVPRLKRSGTYGYPKTFDLWFELIYYDVTLILF